MSERGAMTSGAPPAAPAEAPLGRRLTRRQALQLGLAAAIVAGSAALIPDLGFACGSGGGGGTCEDQYTACVSLAISALMSQAISEVTYLNVITCCENCFDRCEGAMIGGPCPSGDCDAFWP